MRSLVILLLITGSYFSYSQSKPIKNIKLVLEKRSNPEKRRLVKSSDILLIKLDGTRYQSSFSLGNNAIILESDTVAFDDIKKIRCNSIVGFAQGAAGYTILSAGSYFTFAGMVGLMLSANSGDSFLFPEKTSTGPPLALMMGGIGISFIGSSLTGMNRSFDLATKWRLVTTD